MNNDYVWIKKCIDDPETYKIWVDNDSIFVEDIHSGKVVYDFNSYGYDFVVVLFEYLGANVDYV